MPSMPESIRVDILPNVLRDDPDFSNRLLKSIEGWLQDERQEYAAVDSSLHYYTSFTKAAINIEVTRAERHEIVVVDNATLEAALVKAAELAGVSVGDMARTLRRQYGG